MLILDTNAVIGYLKGDARLTKLIDANGRQGKAIALPSIVITELLSYPVLTEEHVLRIEGFLRAAHILTLTEGTARYAANIRREHHLTTIDAIIAATAILADNAHLVTLDKAFQKVRIVPLLDIAE